MPHNAGRPPDHPPGCRVRPCRSCVRELRMISRREFRFDNASTRIDLHQRRHNQTLDVGIETAKCRWRARAAAWVQHGRGNIRTCPAIAPRGQARCRAARSGQRRQCARAADSSHSPGVHHTASSKSLAVSPSMVTIGRSRKSRRPWRSCSEMYCGAAPASASTSKESGAAGGICG